MDALIGVVEEETKLVRAGRLTEVKRLGGQKTDLARLYLADTARLQASQPYLAKAAPGVLKVLRERHNTFRAMLQVNLTVLATAHAVAEGIIRGVSSEINRQAAMIGYLNAFTMYTATSAFAVVLVLMVRRRRSS